MVVLSDVQLDGDLGLHLDLHRVLNRRPNRLSDRGVVDLVEPGGADLALYVADDLRLNLLGGDEALGRELLDAGDLCVDRSGHRLVALLAEHFEPLHRFSLFVSLPLHLKLSSFGYRSQHKVAKETRLTRIAR